MGTNLFSLSSRLISWVQEIQPEKMGNERNMHTPVLPVRSPQLHYSPRTTKGWLSETNDQEQPWSRIIKKLTRSLKLKVITTTILVLFTLLFIIRTLAFSDSLHLDSLIDPVTFRLLPPGDPTNRIPSTNVDPSVAEALAAVNRSGNGTMLDWISKHRGDEQLRKNRPATRFTCDNGKDGRPKGSLVFLAIFTTPALLAKRQLIRSLFIPDLPPTKPGEAPLIDVLFISGRPSNDNWKYQLETEKSKYGDIAWLDTVDENIDGGKTARFFEWVADGADGRWPSSNGTTRMSRDPRKLARPQFVMKADDDVFLVIPNLLKHISALKCSHLVYWGTGQGSDPSFPPYFRGLGYALSWPLVEWIGTAGMDAASIVGTEDAKVGSWLFELNGAKELTLEAGSGQSKEGSDANADDESEWVERYDVGWKMGDWDQMVIDEESIGMHWLKLDEWVPMVKRKVLVAWENAGREYRWDYYNQPSAAYPTSNESPSIPLNPS